MRWRTTTPSGLRARASRTCPSTAGRRALQRSRRTAAHPRDPAEQQLAGTLHRAPRGTGADERCSYPPSMKVAVVSDIHGNRHAFEASLEAIADSSAAELWCLGDLVGYGAEPDACVALARAHAAVCLAGNHDLAVTGDIPLDEFSRGASLAAQWTQEVIDPENLAFLEGLSPQGAEGQIGLYHA